MATGQEKPAWAVSRVRLHADPREDLENAFYQEWQDEHEIRTVSEEKEAKAFWNSILTQIIRDRKKNGYGIRDIEERLYEERSNVRAGFYMTVPLPAWVGTQNMQEVAQYIRDKVNVTWEDSTDPAELDEDSIRIIRTEETS